MTRPAPLTAEPTTVSSAYRVAHRATSAGIGASVENVPPADLLAHAEAPSEVHEAYEALVAANTRIRETAQARIAAQTAVRAARLASEIREAQDAADDAEVACREAVAPANTAAQALADALSKHGHLFGEIAQRAADEAQADAVIAWEALADALARREAAYGHEGRPGGHPLSEVPGLSSRLGVSLADVKAYALGASAVDGSATRSGGIPSYGLARR
ncbi:hypothetical protein GCM10009616_11370 [Microlunatus lacustris]